MIKRNGAIGSFCKTPVSTWKMSVLLSGVTTRAEVFSYITCIALTISEGIPYAARILNILDRSIESNAFLKSIKVITASFLWLPNSSMILSCE